MTIQLDDLLPPNDAVYEPPEDLREMFRVGSPIFEAADIYKFNREGIGSFDDFRDGYMAAIFEVFLKAGIPFRVRVRQSNVDRLVQRAKDFRREVGVGRWESDPETVTIHVSKHERD